MKSRGREVRSQGFSLVEMMIVVGILSVVAVGTSLQLVNSYRDSLRMQSKANMIQTKGLIGRAFGRISANSNRTCRDTLVPVGSFNTSPSAQTDVQIRLSNTEVLAANSQIPGAAQFQINRLYLADQVSLAPARPNSWLTNLYMIANVGAMDALTPGRPRSVATIVITLDSSGAIKECNVSMSTPTANETCDAMFGMVWNAQTGECDQALALDTNFNLEACPPGTRKISGVCIPTASGCGNGQIARGFDLGITKACAAPPLNPAVGVPTAPVPPPVEGVPNQTPAPVVSGRPTVPPVTTGVIAPTSAAATPTPSAECQTGIGETNYNRCIETSSCAGEITGIPSATSGQCVATSGTPYSTPPPSSTPSNAPPADFSCACNSARIPNGEYCAFCIAQVDLGFGYVDYAYGVNRCINGTLVPDSSGTAAFDPSSECSGGYAPVNRTGPRFRQFEGYNQLQ